MRQRATCNCCLKLEKRLCPKKLRALRPETALRKNSVYIPFGFDRRLRNCPLTDDEGARTRGSPIESLASWKFHEGVNANGRRGLKLTANPNELESFVDAAEAAEFLAVTRRRILELARTGKLPAHPIGDGARRVWRFRLSELSNAIATHQNSVVTSDLINSRVTKAAPRAID